MNILIDGVDGTGKTDVCQLLSKELGLPVIKMPNMKKYFNMGLTEEFSELYNNMLVQFKDIDFIQDRGFTSSIVYNKVYKRGANLEYLLKIENDLRPKVFILTAKDEILFQRRPKDEIIEDKQRILLNEEFQFLAEVRDYTLIDTSNINQEEVCQIILENL